MMETIYGSLATLDDLPSDLSGRLIIVRADLNVPRDAKGRITDDTRIRAHQPTLQELLSRRARVILLSHLGRPQGWEESFSLRGVAAHLQALLGISVSFIPKTRGAQVRQAIDDLESGSVLMLENVRFELTETKNDTELANFWGSLAEFYVNDAFGVSHRKHASVYGISAKMPSYAGRLLAREVEILSNLLIAPVRPFVTVLGGAKVSDKMGVLRSLLTRVDHLLIGGGMANTFLLAQGYDVGQSLVEKERLPMAEDLLQIGEGRIHLPVDVVLSESFSGENVRTSLVSEIKANEMILDIGPRTQERYTAILRRAETVFWNGPMGVFENPLFAQGTKEIAHTIMQSSAYSVVGGGDSVAAISQLHGQEQISYISTGGGASLELLEGKLLPGVERLKGVN